MLGRSLNPFHAIGLFLYPMKSKNHKALLKWLGKRGYYRANIYLFKFNNRNTRKRCAICSELTIKTPQRGHCRRSRVFIVNFKHISHLFLVFLLLNLNKSRLAG